MQCSIRPLERVPNARYAKRVYEVSIAFLGKYCTTVNANCVKLAIIEACRLLLSAKKVKWLMDLPSVDSFFSTELLIVSFSFVTQLLVFVTTRTCKVLFSLYGEKSLKVLVGWGLWR